MTVEESMSKICSPDAMPDSVKSPLASVVTDTPATVTVAPSIGVSVPPAAKSLASSSLPVMAVTPVGPVTVMVMDSESVRKPSLTVKVRSMTPTWVASGWKMKAPVAPLSDAPSGKGSGVAEKAKGSLLASDAVSVRLSVEPSATVWLPTGSKTGARLVPMGKAVMVAESGALGSKPSSTISWAT